MRHDLAVGSVADAVIVHGFENRFIAAEGIFPCLRSVQLIEGVLDGISVKIHLGNKSGSVYISVPRTPAAVNG